MWEVFTCGKMPYSRMKNAEVVERVQRGHVLERPKYCAKDVYEVSADASPPVVGHGVCVGCLIIPGRL